MITCPFCKSDRIRFKKKVRFSLKEISTISVFVRCKKCGATGTSSDIPYDPFSLRLLTLKRYSLMWKQKSDKGDSSDA